MNKTSYSHFHVATIKRILIPKKLMNIACYKYKNMHLLNVLKYLKVVLPGQGWNTCMANWFFYQRVIKFMDVFYMDIMEAKDYWLRFEYQHRGIPYFHEVVWLQDVPDIQNILATDDSTGQEELIRYIDKTVSTTNTTWL